VYNFGSYINTTIYILIIPALETTFEYTDILKCCLQGCYMPMNTVTIIIFYATIHWHLHDLETLHLKHYNSGPTDILDLVPKYYI